jgi:hypothetical protein
MENEMRLSRSGHAGVALACGFVLTALILAASSSVAEAGGSATVTRHLTLHHEPFDPRATAQVPAAPTLFSPPSFGSYVPAPRKPETDGLSRNPNDCVKYGRFTAPCPDERAGAAILASNYGEAAAIDVYGETDSLPPAISGNSQYFLWGRAAMTARSSFL